MKTQLLCLSVVCLTFSLPIYAQEKTADNHGGGSTDQRFEELLSNKEPVHNEAYAKVLREHKALVDRLIQEVNQLPDGIREIKEPGKIRAIWLLELFREPKAAVPLAKRISAVITKEDFGTGRHPPFLPRPHQISQKALVAIGQAALDPVFEHYCQSQQDEDAHINVIVSILISNPYKHDLAVVRTWFARKIEMAKTENERKCAQRLLETTEKRYKEWLSQQQPGAFPD